MSGGFAYTVAFMQTRIYTPAGNVTPATPPVQPKPRGPFDSGFDDGFEGRKT